MADLPPASTYLNYPGDVVTHIVGEVMGRNMLGEYLTAVDAHYDPEANRTRVGFAYGVHRREEVTDG